MKPRTLAGRLFVLVVFLGILPLAAQDRGLLVVKAKDGSQVGSFKSSYALVVGESQYSAGWPKLEGVKTDVRLVAQALESAGFRVTVKQDLAFEELKDTYENFISAYGLEENSRLLFYYAGHGHTLKLAGGRDMGYIVPVDAPNPNADVTGFKKKALPMQQFDTWAKRIESRHALFLFDSCFSGSIFNITRAIPDNISEKTVKPVRQFITSGSADEEVPDKSIFRDQFLAGISGEADRSGDGYVTGAELGEFLDEKVVNYSHRSQHPQYGKIQDPALDKGDFVFAVSAKARAAALAPAASSAAASTGIAELMVRAEAGAEVLVDGVSYGKAPLLVKKLDAGRPLKVQARTATMSGSVEVTLNPGELRELAVALAPLAGNLFVTANETAVNLWIDGVDKGPLGSGIFKGMQVGSRKIELKGAGLYGSASANVAADETTEVKATVYPVGRIDVEAPSDVAVRFVAADGRTWTGTGRIRFDNAPAGAFTVSATGDGYESASTNIAVAKGAVAKWTPYVGGTIEFAVSPDGAAYRLEQGGGVASGLLRDLAPGDRRIVISKPGYHDATVSVTVSLGKRTRVETRLERFAPAVLSFADYGMEIGIEGADAEAASGAEAGSRAYRVAAGVPVKLAFVSPYAERLDIGAVEETFAEGEERALDLPAGRFALPWMPAGASVVVGSARTLTLRNEAESGFRSPPLPPGEYRIALAGSSAYSGSVTVRPDSLTEPSDYRSAMGGSLEAERLAYAKRLSSKRTKTTFGFASLAAGALGALGAGASYFLGAQAMDAYNSAADTDTAVAQWKAVELYGAIFPAAAALGGLGLGLSPVLLFGGPDPAALQRSIDALDEGIKALGR